jgi:hypothetical protein
MTAAVACTAAISLSGTDAAARTGPNPTAAPTPAPAATPGLADAAAAEEGPLLAQAPPGAPKGMNVIDTSSPFDHDVHMSPAKMGGKAMGCESCHDMVAADGSCPKQEVRFPKHEACAGCHAASFYTPPLTICSNCHTSTKFAKSNPLRELTRQVTPRKSEFSHRAHLDPKKNTDCTSCHAVMKGGDVMGHPSHPNCCQCHAGSGSGGKVAQPTMNKCGECHNTAKNAGRPPSKIHSFSHKAHKEDPRTSSSTSCQTCHVNMISAGSLRQIQAPPMPVCVQCHDGSDPTQPNPNNPAQRGTGAFHFSSCLKCHISGSISGTPLPPSHPTEAAPPGAIQ